VVVTTGAIRSAKFQSNHHHQQPTSNVLLAGCPSCHPTNSVRALKEKPRQIMTEINIFYGKFSIISSKQYL